MNPSARSRTCPECGLELPPDRQGPGCPRCALQLAFLQEAPDDVSESGPHAVSAPASPSSSLPASAAGRRPSLPRYFGDYEILGEIARGGMGVVYRARQLGLNRVVALKMVQSHHLLSDEARLRFQVEIEAVAQLHHPHIVALYESGEKDGAHYFTMRLVEGGDLAEYVAGRRGVRECVQLLVKVCRAVHYAHQRGIIHRDLKPSNILVDLQGEPHVADFGLAKSVDQDSGFTFTSSVLGSPSYMAPEQAAGHTRQLTTAVDVYGLGALLFHVLTGRPPFQAPTAIETLRQVVDQDAPSPRTFHAAADPDLSTIALKCLHKSPAARYGTAEELAQDLERWLNGDPIRARPLGPVATAWRWGRRHPVASLLGVALLVSLVAVVVATSVAAMRIRSAEKRADAHLGNALISEARALRLRGTWAGRSEGLERLREAAALPLDPALRRRARDELLALLPNADLPFVAAWPRGGRRESGLSCLETRLERVATVEGGTSIVLRALSTGAVLRRFEPALEAVTALDRFSPDGRFLVSRHADHLQFWDVETGRPCWRQPGSNVVYDLAARGGAPEVVLQEAPNEAVFRALPSGRELRRWKLNPERPGGRQSGWHTLVLAPDGRTLAGASAISQIVEILDADTGRAVRHLTNGVRTTAMAWSPDGARFAVASGDGRVYVWHLNGEPFPRTSPTFSAHVQALAFRADGRILALAGSDRHVRFLDLEDLRVVHEVAAETGRFAYTLDGQRVGPVRVDGRWGWFEVRPSREYREFDSGVTSRRVVDLRFSADGHYLAVGTPGDVALCDPVEGSVVVRLPSWRMSTVVFHPETRGLLTANTPGLLYFEPRETMEAMLRRKPRLVNAARRWRALDITPDGRRLAAYNGQSNAVLVFDETFTNQVARFGPHTEAETLVVSPDGSWVATGSYEDRSIRVWDVAREELAWTRPLGIRPQAAFSGDGRWIAVWGDTFELRRVGTWDPAPRLPFPLDLTVPNAVAFSPDGRILGVVGDFREIHLFDLQSFAALGRLLPSEGMRPRALAFGPDGNALAAVDPEGRVAVWDLDRVRRLLAELRLGGDAWGTRPRQGAFEE